MKLIVTADDFGMGYETSRGIVHAHLFGPVTCTSLMAVTGDHAKRSIALLADAPALEIGLHLVLSGNDKPLVATRASGLVSRAGTFHSLPQLILRAVLGRLDRQACEDEIAAQASAFSQLMGRPPAYIDGHHHSHQLPTVRDAVLSAMTAGVLPRVTRATVEPEAIVQNVRSAKTRRFVARRMGRAGLAAFRGAGAAVNDWFFGMLDSAELQQPMPWQAYLQNLPATGTVEWVVHPGFEDPSLIGRDSYLAERVLEAKALTGPDQQSLWKREGIELITKSRMIAVPV